MNNADEPETYDLQTEVAYFFSRTHRTPINLGDYALALSLFRVPRDMPWREALCTYMRVETRIDIARALRREHGVNTSITRMTDDLRGLVHNATLREEAAKFLDDREWRLSVQELKAEVAHDATERAHEVIEWKIGGCFDDDIVHIATQKLYSHIRDPDDGQYTRVSASKRM